MAYRGRGEFAALEGMTLPVLGPTAKGCSSAIRLSGQLTALCGTAVEAAVDP
jgi:hypothetical protein